jgi:hypothetical protein
MMLLVQNEQPAAGAGVGATVVGTGIQVAFDGFKRHFAVAEDAVI